VDRDTPVSRTPTTGDTAASGGEVLLVKLQVTHCFPYVEVSHKLVEFFKFSSLFSIVAKLTGEFTLLEEPTNGPDTAIVMIFPADRPDFVESERRVEPKEPTRKFTLPIVRSIS
jgi:hypothetical protein